MRNPVPSFRRADSPSQHLALVMALVAVMAGLAIPFYVGQIGAKAGPLLALPLLIVFGMLLLYSRLLLLLLILALRSIGDLVLETTKFSLGGQMLGVGALLNAFVILTVLLLVLEKPGVVPKRAVAAWFAFFAAMLFGILPSPEKGSAIRYVLAASSYFAVFASAFYFVDSRKSFERMLQLVLLSSFLPVVYALVELGMKAGGGLAGFRLESTFQHPNIFAFYLVLILTLSLYLVKSESVALPNMARAALGAYMIILLVMLAATQTRSAWVAFVVIFAAYAIRYDRRYLVYLAIAIGMALLVPDIRERLADVGANTAAGPYAQLDSFSWRLQAWQASLGWMTPSHYLTGYGIDAFRFHSLQFSPFFSKEEFYAHNVYVQLFFDTGLLGLLGYLAIHAQLLHGLRALREKDGLAAFMVTALVVAYLVVSLSDNMLGYLVFNWYFWFVCGVAYAFAMRRRDSDSKTPA